MKKPRKPEQFIRRTTYPGGKKALDEFIKKNLKYPVEAIKEKIEGTVKLKFDIDHKGHTSNIVVEHGIGGGCDEEAIRLVGMLKFNAIKHRGVKVVFHKKLDIHFRLPQLPKGFNVKYTISSTLMDPKTKGSPYTITYTIKSSKK